MKYLNQYILSLLIIFSIASYGQSNNYHTYGIEEGLIQSQIEDIIQDSEGNLWIGTIGGLSVYNGIEFKSFTSKEGLSEDWISSIYKDDNNNIWMGHWGGGITFFDKEKQKFEILKFEKDFAFRKILYINQLDEEKILIVTEGAGIFYYSNGSISNISSKLKTLNITDAYFDKSTQLLWLATNEGLQIAQWKDSELKGFMIDTGKKIPSNNLTSISPALNNEIWIGTTNNGIFRMVANTNIKEYYSAENIEKYIELITTNEGLSSNEIACIHGGEDGSVWIGTKSNGINVFKADKNFDKIEGIQPGEVIVFGNYFERKYYNANLFFSDREGNVWIGSEIGLHKYLGELFKVYNEDNFLPSNLIWSVKSDSKNRLWVGSSKGLTQLVFPENGNDIDYENPEVTNYSTSNGLTENLIISVCEDQQGRIWAGTENKGINIIQPGKGVVKRLGKSTGMISNNIFDIKSDKKGNIWVGTEEGLVQITTDSFKIKNFTTEDGLGGNKVYHILVDNNQNIWCGVLGGYLSVLDGKKFRKFTEKDGFKEKFVINLTQSNDGTVWIGTYQGGLFSYKQNQFQSFSTEDGMISNFPHFTQTHNNNTLWIGHNRGIEKFDLNSKFVPYGSKNGFKGLETNENAATIDSRGNLWFGTVKGLVKFDATKERNNVVEPVTKIDQLKILLEDSKFPSNNEFSHKDNNLTFDVIGISLMNPNEVTYSYRLTPQNKDWSPKTKERSFNFSGLAPGTYTFEVKASNNSGLENSEAARYTFTILPPWWQTTWARLLFVAVIISAVVIYIKYRESALKKRQAYLEEQVALRTDELRKEKEIVEEQNVEIETKNKHIMDSITYAKRIQSAILPPDEQIEKVLPKSFVYFNPRDIVSGDFYWVAEAEGKILYAAADCTGHGVPGAFMSLIGHNLLDKIVNEYNIFQPAKLLDKLSENIVEVLRQDQDSGVKDGMDISICSIDYSNMKAEFAGAYNPLFLVRDGEIQEFDADRIPIGKSYTGEREFYNNFTIDLKENDCLYTFSDGFVDQMGGSKGKKFMFKRFRKMLIELSEMPIEKQEARLEDIMTRWKGEKTQFDDMLIFGVKI